MTREQWQHVRQLFEAALDAGPADLRQWLQAQSADATVRAEVESLLDHHFRAGSFLIEPLPERVPALLEEEEEAALGAGAVVGQYTLVRELGRGAMGRVYLATDARLGAVGYCRIGRNCAPSQGYTCSVLRAP